MRLLATYAVLVALASSASAQSTTTTTQSAAGDAPTVTGLTYNSNTSPSPIATTFTYVSGNTTATITGTNTRSASNATVTGISSTTASGTVLVGSSRSTTLNGTATLNSTATSSSARPTNTQPCNGYPEFCTRKYSNITYVAAHNSPFTIRNNVASNQALDVTTQLNDGVHNENGTLYLCHTSCDLLNAGTLVAYLTTVNEWLQANRYEVITILMGNYDVLDPSVYVQPVSDSGLLEYAYVPSTVPMARDGWPTLGEMILRNKRVVFMLDYEANQAEIPWLLDEFSYMWETPFSPTDRDFPCDVNRPPDQARDISEQRMNMANHNLNIAINALGFSLLVPAYNLLNETNAESGYGSVGAAVGNCTADWGRPPNFLLVDYYNIGSPINGSVLAVAAAANNVTYDTASCCGTVGTNSGTRVGSSRMWALVIPIALATFLL